MFLQLSTGTWILSDDNTVVFDIYYYTVTYLNTISERTAKITIKKCRDACYEKEFYLFIKIYFQNHFCVVMKKSVIKKKKTN